MQRLPAIVCCGALIAGVVGCAGEGRYLTLAPRPVETERRAFELHDPFPDESIAPDTFSRPRSYVRPRTEERKTSDLQALRSRTARTRGDTSIAYTRSPYAAPVAPYEQAPVSPQLVYTNTNPGETSTPTTIAGPAPFPVQSLPATPSPSPDTIASPPVVNPF